MPALTRADLLVRPELERGEIKGWPRDAKGKMHRLAEGWKGGGCTDTH